MRERWRLAAAALAVGVAGALAVVASSHAAITITSLDVQANGTNIPSASGPNGAGYDIRIVANLSGGTDWESTSWSSAGVTRCVDHGDEDENGTHTRTLKYEYESNPALKEAPPRALPDPDKVGPSEHVFPPPVGASSQLTIRLFDNDNCGGNALASQSVSITTKTPGANEALTVACQVLKVAVVLDESGSIGDSADEVREATKALARGLSGTGASMAVFKFSSSASDDFIEPYQVVNQAFIDGDLDDYLDDYRPNGYTNWDSGLNKVLAETTATNRPDLVVFLTDGNPNKLRGDGNTYEEGYYTPVNAAANVANTLKQDSHMFAIGVGVGVTDALSALRIQAVSGIRSFPEYSIETADYTLIQDFDELEDALADLASNLCNVTVTVKKETDEGKRDAWVYKPGWKFSGRTLLQPPSSQFAYRWFKPNTAGPPVTTTTATQSGFTAAAGTIDFVWRPTSAASLSDITITETVQPGYEAESVSCTAGGGSVVDSDVQAVAQSFTLRNLRIRDHVYCVVRNRFKRSTVQVVKQWVGDPSSATIFVDQNGTAPYDASKVATASGDSTSFDYPVSTSVRVGETAVPAGYSATIDCGGGPQPYGGGPFPVTSPAVDGEVITCTITNKQLRSTVQVVKNWVGTASSATIFVDRNGTDALRRLEGGDGRAARAPPSPTRSRRR